MKKIRVIISALVILSVMAASLVCASAAVPEEAVLNLLPETVDSVEPFLGHDTRYSDAVEDGAYVMTLLADGAATPDFETNFAESCYHLGGVMVDLNKTPVIKFKAHFTLPEGSQFNPRMNFNLKCTAEGANVSLMASTGLADYLEVTDNAINTDQETEINLYEVLYKQGSLPVSGVISVDEIDFYMGGDEGLVLTFDYMYFVEATPTVNGQEVDLAAAASSAPASSAASAASSAPAASNAPAASSSSDSDSSDVVLYTVIGVAAALIVAGVIIFIVVKSRKSAPSAAKNTEAGTDEKSGGDSEK